jgi:hypothetical protein
MAGTAGIVFAGTAHQGSTQHIAGSAQLTFDASGQLIGKGRLHGVGTVTFSETALIRATGRLVGAAHLSFDAHAQLTGAVFITPAVRHIIGHSDDRTQIVHAHGRARRVHTAPRSERDEP